MSPSARLFRILFDRLVFVTSDCECHGLQPLAARAANSYRPVDKPPIAFATFGAADSDRLILPDAKLYQFVANDRRNVEYAAGALDLC